MATDARRLAEDDPATAIALARARGGDEAAFRVLTDPYRRELQVHCYRLLGSVQDAEDLLQETLFAAWRGLDRFEGRSSVRAWLYRIATNRCLNAIRDGDRRASGPAPSATTPALPEPALRGETPWLQPYPESLLEGLEDAAPGPEARYEMREAVALAFVAGLQRLPPRQRAVLVLRDVLGLRAPEVADMLASSEASVNGALQRARATLDERRPAAGRLGAPLPRSRGERALVGRFADAFEHGDIPGVVALLTEDAWLTMPPEPVAYHGPEAIGAFFRDRGWWATRRVRVVPSRANAQPGLGYYLEDVETSSLRLSGLLVLTLAADRIAAITRFGADSLDRRFELTRILKEMRT